MKSGPEIQLNSLKKEVEPQILSMITPLHYTYRREMVDKDLADVCGQFHGTVLDLGGKKMNKRGRFRPDQFPHLKWVYLNLIPSEGADVLADALELPLKTDSMDGVVCAEVLECVANPEQVIQEIRRILKRGALLFITVPFLNRVHDTSPDLQRFTEEKVRTLVASGFDLINLRQHGYFFSVLADFLKTATAHIPNQIVRYLVACVTYPIYLILRSADVVPAVQRSKFLRSFTTGYSVLARKNEK